MSTLVLQAAGSVVGTAIGGPIGGLIGRAAGGLVGAAVDGRLFASPHGVKHVEGPRLKTVSGLSSTEGAPIPRLYGRARVGGEIIWATRFLEHVDYRTTGGGRAGKGGRSGAAQPVTVTTVYSYYANIAVGLCEGPIAFVRRIWADGRELDLSGLTIRVHRGTEEQDPDPLVVAKEGADRAPAYRGTAYVVFEGLPLEPFGNRLPQLSFEVVRPVSELAAGIRAVQIIPGAGEFVYQPSLLVGPSGPLNRHQLQAATDWEASLDALQGLCPKLKRVGLVVTWFGSDLRAGMCRVEPKVEDAQPRVSGTDWSVSGTSRAAATVVSRYDGRASHGGTPDDASVIAAIRDLRSRGLAVTLNPFLLMDIPAGNALTDPWTGAPSQPAYPWRGRLTASAAPGRPGSPDGTAAAAAQIRAFFGSARPEHFAAGTAGVSYAGPAEWTYRRLVLHYAALAKAAGGVDTILIGSELVGLTRLRSAPGVYPAVAELVALARDVRQILGPGTRVSYAADWTEYGAHVPSDGELRFPLDPLWASPDIDAVSIDAWWPLSDWRDGPLHHDADAALSATDPDYLLAGTAGGEGYDWYYADAAARAAQARRPIADGAYGKPFAYRPKDLRGWWSSAHVERAGGFETSATAWVPRSKPIWLNEVGCPAIDKGGNAPSAFPDPKSSTSSRPPFSRGNRDDLMLHRGTAAMLRRFDPGWPGHPEGSNPLAAVPGGRMVDPSRIHVWAWDARPYPAFPTLADVWADGPSWETGHWLSGRLDGAPVDAILRAILADHGLDSTGPFAVDGYAEGYVIDRPLSGRAAIEPLAGLFGFDAIASGDGLRFADRRARAALALTEDDLVPDKDGNLVRRTRMQESELPHELALAFEDAEETYAHATVFSRRLAGRSKGTRHVEVAAVLRRPEAGRLADIALHDAWVGRESAEFSLRPGLVGIEVGDVVTLPQALGASPLRIERIRDAETREVTARAVDRGLFTALPRAGAPAASAPPLLAGRPQVQVVDWPVAAGDPVVLQSLAVAADPWPGRMAVWRSVDGGTFELLATVEAPAAMGRTLRPLGPGPLWRFDDASELIVTLPAGAVPSADDLSALSGSRLLGVLGPDGAWEILAFARAELTAADTWTLRRLLRGLGGSERCARRPAPAGSTAVLLDQALVALAAGASALGQAWQYRVVPAGRDIADPAMVAFSAAPGPAALLPLSPVCIVARRGDQGIIVSWIRRGRVDADAWEPLDIPLGEETASFRCEITRPGGTRVLASDAPAVLYPAADERADFGRPQSSLFLRIVQLSVAAGAGEAFAGTVPIT